MENLLTFILSTGVALTGSAILGAWTMRNKAHLPYPPGPKPLPVIGNLLDMPKEKDTEMYYRWYQEYGDIVHISVLGQHIIHINTAQAAADLFDRRAMVYSDRPHSVMMDDLIGQSDWSFANMRYGNEWRAGRRLFHAGVNQSVVKRYKTLQIRSARAFVQQLRSNPDNVTHLIRQYVGSTIIDIVYGMEGEKNNYMVSVAEELMKSIGLMLTPGKYFVEFLPALRHLPRWIPGAGFRKDADRGRDLSEEMREMPLREVKQAITAGAAKPSMTTFLLETGEEETKIGDVMSIAYEAGSDTSVSSLVMFILAMCNHPEAQEKAQAEIDTVVGAERLPDFSDRENLPYVNAVILETLRWYPVAPIGVPRATAADDEYNGYFIPKGSIVIGNVWSILHNPDDYPEPMAFRPERFLRQAQGGKLEIDPSVRDPNTAAFGFGRRICPGRYLADQALFATAVTVLHTLSITPPLDKSGQPLYPQVQMSDGLAAHPAPFQIVIKPRSVRAAELIDLPLPERGV